MERKWHVVPCVCAVRPGLHLDVHLWGSSLQRHSGGLHPQRVYRGSLPTAGHAAQHAEPGEASASVSSYSVLRAMNHIQIIYIHIYQYVCKKLLTADLI